MNEPDDHFDTSFIEFVKNIAKSLAQSRSRAFNDLPLVCSVERIDERRFDRRSESDKAGSEPIPIAIFDLFVRLVIIEIEGGEIEEMGLDRAVNSVEDRLVGEMIICSSVACVAKGLLLHGVSGCRSVVCWTDELEGGERMEDVGGRPAHDDHLSSWILSLG